MVHFDWLAVVASPQPAVRRNQLFDLKNHMSGCYWMHTHAPQWAKVSMTKILKRSEILKRSLDTI